MTFWIVFWKVCLIAVLAIFALMAVLVTIGGWRDVRKLLRRLDDEDAE